MNGFFGPYSVKNVEFRNRFVMPGMQRALGRDYSPSAQTRESYRACARGGVGLVISEGTHIDHPSSTGQVGFVLMIDERSAPAWKECIVAVHDEGGRMFVQLAHEGAVRRQHLGGPDPTYPTLSPSGLLRAGQPNGRAATPDELAEIRDSYVTAAVLAGNLGADGVEIHAAHGYFLDQFLWHETNRRTDGYGGPELADRVRYPAEIVRAVRAAVGEEFLISFRFSQWKEVDYGAKIAPSVPELGAMLAVLRGAGVDLFHVSTRRFYEPEFPGSDLGLAGWTKQLTDAAVITVGSVGLSLDVMDTFYTDQELVTNVERTMELLTARYGNGEFDMVAVGRGHLGDPEWVNKVSEGRYDDIVVFDRALMQTALEDWDDSMIRDSVKDS